MSQSPTPALAGDVSPILPAAPHDRDDDAPTGGHAVGRETSAESVFRTGAVAMAVVAIVSGMGLLATAGSATAQTALAEPAEQAVPAPLEAAVGPARVPFIPDFDGEQIDAAGPSPVPDQASPVAEQRACDG